MEVAYFELNFKPNVALVSVVRRFVTEFYQRFLGDPDGTSRVALATHELLENAVKYSKDGETTIRIGDRCEQTVPRIVRIPCCATAPARSTFVAIRELLDGIAKAPDAFKFYQQLIAVRAKQRQQSGLGLTRICAEGEIRRSPITSTATRFASRPRPRSERCVEWSRSYRSAAMTSPGAAAHRDGPSIQVWVKGNADYAALDALETLLTRIHAEAGRSDVRETVVDLRELEFMNSSCFKSFVTWINDIQELEERKQYKVKFRSNPKMHWQKRSLHSLRCFAVELISVEET